MWRDFWRDRLARKRHNFKWPGAESNCRHADFQSAALPTELPGRTMQQKNLAGSRAWREPRPCRNLAVRLAESLRRASLVDDQHPVDHFPSFQAIEPPIPP